MDNLDLRPRGSPAPPTSFPRETDPTPNQHLNYVVKVEKTHGLSVLGPNEKYIHAMRKRDMANQLMLGDDRLGDDQGTRQSAQLLREQIEVLLT